MIINKSSDSVYVRGRQEVLFRYLNMFRKYKPLTFEKENEYITRYKVDGDLNARDMLIKCNQRFLYSAAKRFSSDAETILDLIDEGNLGLIEAIEKFDFTFGVRLLSYAQAYISRNMVNYFCNDRMITRPMDTKIGSRVANERNIFYSIYQREPTYDELRDILYKKYGIDVKSDDDLSQNRVVRIDDPVFDGENSYTVENTDEYLNATNCYNDYDKTIEQDNTKAIVLAALNKINPKEAEIVKMRYGIGYDHEYMPWEIASVYNVTETRIHQIVAKATKSLEYVMTA